MGGGGGVPLYCRTCSTFFHSFSLGIGIGIGIELLYLSDVELSHSITEWGKKHMGI